MKRYIIHLFLALSFAAMSACSDDGGLNIEPQPSENEVAVAVEADLDVWASQSRAIIELPEKEAFKDGDVIHVQGEFVTGSSKVWRYDTYRYSNGRWVANSADPSLKWPWNATKASFTAYYFPALTQTLPDGKSYECEMGYNPDRHDPLVAYAEDVELHCAVNFHFRHLCTRLVIENTKNNYAAEYWFYKENIKNVFKLGFVQETDAATGLTYNKLGLTFESDNTKNEGAISAVKVIDSSTGDLANAGYVVYYLEPGKYYGSDLNYSGNRLYLKLNVDALDKPEGEGSDGLEAGRTYFLDIEKARGVINNEETEDPWDDDEDPVSDFDVQELVDAISNGKEFEDILELDNAGNLVLTKNLDFQNKEFNPKSIPTNISFDGGYHYVTNTVHHLFNRNSGSIRNLELRKANISAYTKNDDGSDLTNVGALVATNLGYIDNIRLRDNNIDIPALPLSSNVISVGGLVGSHESGQISNVYLIGGHSSVVSDPVGDVTRGRLYFGGIAGQSHAPIKDVSMLQDNNGNPPVISMKLDCNMGIYSVGGVVGMLTSGLENCSLTATIDCSASTAGDCAVGGLFGREDAINGGFAIRNCNVDGTVLGAYAETINSSGNVLFGRSVVGGIGGSVKTSDLLIIDCRSFCDVYDCFNSGKGYNTSNVTDEVFGSGAAFGRLTANPKTSIHDCIAWGLIKATSLAATANDGGSFVGSFVGYAVGGFDVDFDLNSCGNKVNSVNGSVICGYNWMIQ